VNCAALPSSLIESALFGHERGAFTGALSRKVGRFELADGGTIFLDEIGEIPLDLQAKLLRVLQQGQFERLGETRTRRTDVRVVSATNRDLAVLARDGRFRADLHSRLAVFEIRVPALRERREDVPLLAGYFASRFQAQLHRRIERIPEETMRALVAYDWPGTVRELANVVQRAVILSPGDSLVLDGVLRTAPAATGGTPHAETLDEVERAHVVRVLESCGWRVKGSGNAAERPGVPPSTLRSRMARLGIRRTPR
jgi:transcriptional regulator with GAF, ATPase, and Fis domain